MVWYCPKCGRKISNFIKICTKCKIDRHGNPVTEHKPKSSGGVAGGGGGGSGGKSKVKIIERIKEKKEEAGGGVISALVVMVLVTATLVWFYFSPFNEGLLELLVTKIPNIVDTWQNTYMFLSAAIILALTLEALISHSIKWGVVFVLGFVFLVFLYYIFIPILEAFGVEAKAYWGPLICTLRMEDMQSCMGTVDGEEVIGEKEGDYIVLETEFRTEYAGKDIYRIKDDDDGLIKLNFDSYQIDAEFKNPSDTQTITGFNIISCAGSQCNPGSYLKRAGALNTKDKHIIASLKTTDGYYMDGNCPPSGCVIKPGETLRLSFEVGESFMEGLCDGTTALTCESVDFCVWDESSSSCSLGDDRVTEEIEARIMYEYDYSAEGKWEFIVAGSDEILEPLLKNRKTPTWSDGPLDVIVSFSPTAYVNRTPGIEDLPMDQWPEVSLVIKLEKEEDGSTVFVKTPIKVSRLSDGILIKLGACTSPWDPALTFADDWEGEPSDPYIDFIDLERSEAELKKSHIYFCSYMIDMSGLGEDGKELIPFILRTDYRHQKSMTQRFIEVSGYNV